MKVCAITSRELAHELNLKNDFLSIKRLVSADGPAYAEKGCSLRLLQRALNGETLIFTQTNLSCRGAAAGFGFADGIPNMPGGFGHFIAQGRGEGFPPGERVKCSPELGEAMLLSQPQGVMDGFGSIRIKSYDPADEADTVTALVNMDQLSALIHVFCFRKVAYDSVFACMTSGCASVFRVPFGELRSASPRAVIGNVDVFSRPHFGADTAFFTVSGKDFEVMLADADESMLAAPIWKGVKARL